VWRSGADTEASGMVDFAKGETRLMFMVHPTLSADDMEDVVRAMDKVMRIAVR
jgi:hypothetical protein